MIHKLLFHSLWKAFRRSGLSLARFRLLKIAFVAQRFWQVGSAPYSLRLDHAALRFSRGRQRLALPKKA
jgi:hypothetical protein